MKKPTIEDVMQVLSKQEKTLTELSNLVLQHGEILAYLTQKEVKKNYKTKMPINIEPTNVSEWLEVLCQFYHMDLGLLTDFMGSLQRYCPGSFMSMVIGAVARTLDNTYEDSIRNCDKVYVISTVTGKVCEVPKNMIKSYKYFGAFRTAEQAGFAMNVWQNLKRFIEQVIKDDKC